jgi:hypothetical protein
MRPACRQVLPVEEQLIDEVNRSALLQGNETSWKEAGKSSWLWGIHLHGGDALSHRLSHPGVSG